MAAYCLARPRAHVGAQAPTVSGIRSYPQGEVGNVIATVSYIPKYRALTQPMRGRGMGWGRWVGGWTYEFGPYVPL